MQLLHRDSANATTGSGGCNRDGGIAWLSGIEFLVSVGGAAEDCGSLAGLGTTRFGDYSAWTFTPGRCRSLAVLGTTKRTEGRCFALLRMTGSFLIVLFGFAFRGLFLTNSRKIPEMGESLSRGKWGEKVGEKWDKSFIGKVIKFCWKTRPLPPSNLLF